jgi:hypothetical protein
MRYKRVRPRVTGWNLLVGSTVLLPVFLLAAHLELRLRGAPPLNDDWAYHASGAMVVYLTMILPIALGIWIHSLAIGFVPEGWTRWKRQLAGFTLSILVPVTVVALGLPGGIILWSLPGAALVATAAYGVCSSLLRSESSTSPKGRTDVASKCH